MKGKQIIKIIIDVCMTILLFVLMAFHYVGLQWHEITGAAMLVLFILHHILNGNWYRALGKGKYRSGRVMLAVVDMLLLVGMLLLMFSGIAMSRYVFRFLDLPVSKAWARGIHMTASYAGFLLMGFHIGLHYGMITGMVKKCWLNNSNKACRKSPDQEVCHRQTSSKNLESPFKMKKTVCTWVMRGIAVLIAVYGAHAIYARKFMDYISQKVMFAFFDYEEPVIYFILDYAAIMGLMIFISYYLQQFLQRRILPGSDGNQKQKE